MNHERIEGVLGITSTSLKKWIRGNVDRYPVVGVLPPGVCEGDTVVMRGRWEDRGYGLQFNFRECQSVRPKGVNGVKRYLAQNFKWIGPAIAEEIIRRFGEGFFDIIESDHRRLTEIRGITPQRADEIHAAWSEKKADKEAGLFFATCGISPALQNRIQAAFPKMSVGTLIETRVQPLSRGGQKKGTNPHAKGVFKAFCKDPKGKNALHGPLEPHYGARTETVQNRYLKRGFSGRFHGGVEVSQDYRKRCNKVSTTVS